jgi:uncharacterized membrane protein
MAFISNNLIAQAAIVFMTAGMPIGELRASIPLAILAYGMPVSYAYVISVIGNMLPVPLVYLFGGAWLRYTERRRGRIHRFTHWFVNRAKGHAEDKRARNGLFVAIMLLVAIPFPITGAYTGAVAAFALGMTFKRALLSIFCGVLIAGLLVVLAATGAVSALRVLLF